MLGHVMRMAAAVIALGAGVVTDDPAWFAVAIGWVIFDEMLHPS